jgi:hypothetical protein
MLARLRVLLAMSLLCLGTWFAALALEGYLPARATMVEAAPKSQVKSQPNAHAKPQTKSPLEAKSPQVAYAKPAAVEKRRPASTAQLPWPLSLFGE